MTNVLKNSIYLIIAVLCIVGLSFFAGYMYSNHVHKNLFDDLSQKHLALMSSVSNEKITYSETIDGLKRENQRLLSIIQDYESRPEKVKYITKIETIVKAGEPIIVPVVEGKRPDSHIFKLGNGIPVATFESSETDYKYITYDLELETDIVIGEQTTTVMVTGFSSADPETPYSFPSRVSVKELKIADHKKFKPEFYLGVTADIDQQLTSSVYASIGFPFYHPTENLDIATPRFSFNSTQTKIGVDLVSWNIASKLPLLSDIWISPGASRHLNNNLYTADLTVGSRF